jgi:hypothetical protein
MRTLVLLPAICATTFTVAAQPFEFHTILTSGPTASGSPATGSDLNPIDANFPPITLDTAANTLRLPIGWGSGNNGVDLQSDYQESYLYRINNGTPQDLYRVDTFPGQFFDQVTFGKSGSYDKLVTLTDLGPYTVDQQETDIRNGLWFLRVDSVNFPTTGEIAGQLTPVPEPEHYAVIVGLGLIGFAICRRFKAADAI